MNIYIKKNELIEKLKKEKEVTVRDNYNYLYIFTLDKNDKVKFRRTCYTTNTVFKLDGYVEYNRLLNSTVMFNTVLLSTLENSIR